MTNNLNSQNCFQSNNQQNNFQFLPNGKVAMIIKNQVYIFRSRSKSRFLNHFEKPENTNINNNKDNQEISSLNKSDKEKSKKKKENKVLKERKGDWICYFCKNLNFSFRDICNRCQKTKKESEITSNKFYYLYNHFTQMNNMCNKINK